MRAVKSVSIDSEKRVIITYLDGSTETLYPNCIWCDSEALRDLIKDLLEEKADAITQTIENVTVASFADGADDGLIKKLLVSIEPIQEGTGDPSPENVRPISGRTGLSVTRTGKNLLDWGKTTVSGTHYGMTFSKGVGEGTVVITGTLSSIGSVGPIHYSDYSLSGKGCVFLTEHISGDSIIDTSRTYGLRSKSENVIAFYLTGQVGQSYTETIRISVYYPPAPTTWSPYQVNDYPVNWETEAGTVYGGTLDVVSGKLTVDRAMVDLGTLTWMKIGTSTDHWRFWATLNTMRLDGQMISSQYKQITTSEQYMGKQGIANQASGSNVLAMVSDERYADDVAFKAAMSGVQLVYELATPITVQLTPQEVHTLLGGNNIWSNSGNILELEYTADTKLYIGEQQSASSGTLGMVNRPTVVYKQIEPVGEITDTDSEVTE